MIESGALEDMVGRIDGETADFILINPSIHYHDGTSVTLNLILMDSSVWRCSITDLVASLGFMNLVACFTTSVLRLRCLQSVDWTPYLTRSVIYAHVAVYLEAFRHSTCLLINKPLVRVRLGNTPFAGFADMARRYNHQRLFPWTLGLVRHVNHLAGIGAVTRGYLSRVIEIDIRGRLSLLPLMIINVCEQILTWIETEQPREAFTANQWSEFLPELTAGPQSLIDLYRKIHECALAAESLMGSGQGAYSVRQFLTLLPEAIPIVEDVETELRDKLIELVDRFKLSSDVLFFDDMDKSAPIGVGPAEQDRATFHRYRAALSELRGQGRSSMTIAAWCDLFATDGRHRFRSLWKAALIKRLNEIIGSQHARVNLKDGFGIADRYGCYAIINLGHRYVALRTDPRTLSRLQRQIEAIDSNEQPPDFFVGPDAATLRTRLESVQRQAVVEHFDETFCGYRIAPYGASFLAASEQESGSAGMAPHDDKSGLLIDIDRLTLRRRIFQANLERNSAYTSFPAAAANFRRSSDSAAFFFLFDEEWYTDHYPDRVGSPFEDFINGGSANGRDPSVWFSESWYREAYPHVVRGVAEGCWRSGYEHYIIQGRFLGIDASPFFAEAWYCAAYPDVLSAIRNGVALCGLDHYLRLGLRQGYQPIAEFDESWYLRNYPTAAQAVATGRLCCVYEHFLKMGSRKGFSPGPRFDEKWYLRLNPDVEREVRAGHLVSGFFHWMRHGKREGRSVHSPVIVAVEGTVKLASLDNSPEQAGIAQIVGTV